jgi:hypothetical protein
MVAIVTASLAALVLGASALLWISTTGVLPEKLRNSVKSSNGDAIIWNEEQARARYRSTGRLITKEESLLIAESHLLKVGAIAKGDWLVWTAELRTGKWFVTAERFPPFPGCDTTVTMPEGGKVLDLLPGE